MPIKILKYVAVAHDIWTQEQSGRRFVARCTNKAMAQRIVRLLNDELEQRNRVEAKGDDARLSLAGKCPWR